MSTSQTPHYGLNQWSPEDQFLREEFNTDNARTDAALAALASSVGEKAAQADLTSLTTAVSGKADQTALDSLAATVNTKANQVDLNAVSAANKWIKLCEATSWADAATFDVGLPAWDYSQYSQLQFMFYCTTAVGKSLYMRLNGVADTTYLSSGTTSFYMNASSNYLMSTGARDVGDFGVEGFLTPFRGGAATIAHIYPSAVSSGWLTCCPCISLAQVSFRDLRVLNFYVPSGAIKAGAWCAAYGLLK